MVSGLAARERTAAIVLVIALAGEVGREGSDPMGYHGYLVMLYRARRL